MAFELDTSTNEAIARVRKHTRLIRACMVVELALVVAGLFALVGAFVEGCHAGHL